MPRSSANPTAWRNASMPMSQPVGLWGTFITIGPGGPAGQPWKIVGIQRPPVLFP